MRWCKEDWLGRLAGVAHFPPRGYWTSQVFSIMRPGRRFHLNFADPCIQHPLRGRVPGLMEAADRKHTEFYLKATVYSL